MLDEARKREKVANAFLLATLAASAAQSPKDFVKTGHIEAPGTALMQRWGRVRGEAERNLDHGRVVARNKKKNNVKEEKEKTILPMLLLLMMKKIKEKKKKAFLSHENVEVKTFKTFLNEARQTTFSSRTELEKHHDGIPSGYYANNAGSTENPKWRLKPKEGGVRERQARAERIAILSSNEEKKEAAKKANKLKRAGLDAHHITPLHYSAKIKSSMSDAEWEERKKRDAAQGVYHGHHPKNIMGAVTDKTPESRSRRGIRHRAGGAHELEGQTRDIAHVGHKGLLAAAHKRRLRKEREANK